MLRQKQLTDCQLDIISANAFEKGQENDVGIASEDFLLKPIRIEELLDWIGQRLQLSWLLADSVEDMTPEAPAITERVFPPAAELLPLLDAAGLGYVRGMKQELARLAMLDPRYAEFVAVASEHVKRFEFDALREWIRRGLATTGNSI